MVASIKANYDIVPDIKMDVDYEEKEMTTEQKEVFQALQNEEDLYEDLEDDFVMMAKGGDDIMKENKKKKEVMFKEEVMEEKGEKKEKTA